jgi:predicted nucleic acid-binding Zn ribbon protein
MRSHWGTESEDFKNRIYAHPCQKCGTKTGVRAIERTLVHLCESCKLIEKREERLSVLLKGKKWWEIWK